MHKLHWIFARYMAPAGDDGELDGGAPTDRGDDFIPSGDDDTAGDKPPVKDDAGAKPAADKPAAEAGLRDGAADLDKALEAEAKAAEAATAEAEKKSKRGAIPLERHEALLNRAREERDALARQLANYQQGLKVAETNTEITALEGSIPKLDAEYTKLVADGELDKAAAVMAKIRQTQNAVFEKKSEMRVQAAEVRARESARYDVTVERIEAAYPELNPDDESYDQAKANEVTDLMTAFQKNGATPTAALQRAVKYAMGAPKTAAEKTAVEVTARPTAEQIAAKRKADAATKAAEALGKQPPKSDKLGTDSDKLGGGMSAKDVMNMPQDEFAKLPESVLAKMRGDEF